MFTINILPQIVQAPRSCPTAKISCSPQEAAGVPSMSHCVQPSLGSFYTVVEFFLVIEHDLLFAFAMAAGSFSLMEPNPVSIMHSSC